MKNNDNNIKKQQKNRLIALMLHPCSLNGNDYDSNINCESSCDNGDSDDNSIDNKSMETIMMTKGLFMMTSITML